MAATETNLTIEQGATWEYEIAVTDTGGNALDITGWAVRSQFRVAKAAAGDPYLDLTEVNGRVSIAGSSGIITLALTATETAALRAGEFYYDVELEDPNGVVYRLLQGVVTVDPEVTR